MSKLLEDGGGRMNVDVGAIAKRVCAGTACTFKDAEDTEHSRKAEITLPGDRSFAIYYDLGKFCVGDGEEWREIRVPGGCFKITTLVEIVRDVIGVWVEDDGVFTIDKEAK